MALQANQDLFRFDLSMALSMERDLEQILGTLAGEVQVQQLTHALQAHKQQTQQHVRRVQHAFTVPSDVDPGRNSNDKQ